MMQIMKESKINSCMTENLKALTELDKHNFITVENLYVVDKINQSLKKSLELKPGNSLGLLLSIEFYKKQKNFSLM